MINKDNMVKFNHPTYRFVDNKNFKTDDVADYTLPMDDFANFTQDHLDKFKKTGLVIFDTSFCGSNLDLIDNFSRYLGKSISQNFGRGGNDFFVIENIGGSKILAKSNRTQALHTDNGFAKDAPEIVMLRCQTPSEDGGYSQIVDSSKILEFLERVFPLGVEALMGENAVTFNKLHASISKNLIQVLKNGNIGFDFSPFAVTIDTKNPEVERAYRLIWAYIHNENNQIKFKLQQGQILILDNSRYMHARTEFPEDQKRVMQRIWFDGQGSYDLDLGISINSTLSINP